MADSGCYFEISVDNKWFGLITTKLFIHFLPTEKRYFKLVCIFSIRVDTLMDFVVHPLRLMCDLKRKVQGAKREYLFLSHDFSPGTFLLYCQYFHL